MKKTNFLVSLSTNASDFQREQAAAAEEAARKLGVTVQIIYADNDAITQSQQLLKVIQSHPDARPEAIIVQPGGGTALPQVARAAADAGIGWVVLNWAADYMAELRRAYRVPIFTFSSDHKEIGRIQGRQFAALLPNGGSVLYIQGPSHSPAAQQRTAAVNETKPEGVHLKMLKSANWTEEGGYRAVSSWLRLSTAHTEHFDLIGAQSDLIALGARKAFQEQSNGAEGERVLRFPCTGVDGLPKGGQAWVRSGLLAATVIVPPNAGSALEMLVQAIHTGSPAPEFSLTVPTSYPPTEELAISSSF